MSQDHFATLRCKETGETYVTRINKKRRAGFVKKDIKITLNKYSKKLRKVMPFVETKKPHGKK